MKKPNQMKKYIYAFAAIAFLSLGQSCKKDSEFLDKKPTNTLDIDAAWKDPNLVLSVVGDLYDRYPDFKRIESWCLYSHFD